MRYAIPYVNVGMWYSETGLFQPKKKKATPKKTPAKKTPKEKKTPAKGSAKKTPAAKKTPKKRKKTEVDAGSSSEDDEPLVKKSKAKKPPSVSCLSLAFRVVNVPRLFTTHLYPNPMLLHL